MDSESSAVASGASVAEGASVTLTATPNSGYKFTNWSVSGTGSTLSSTSINPTTFTMGTANSTVTATFATAYTVTCATGLANGSIAADMATAVSGETVTITATPSSGYKLSTVTVAKEGGGSVDAGDIVIDGNEAIFEMPADNVTVSATFEVAYTVTYNDNGATSGSVPVDATLYSSGATVTVASNSGSLAKTGHSFNGWNTAPDGGGTNYAAAATFTISANTTLYAKWSVNSYSVGLLSIANVTLTGTYGLNTLNENDIEDLPYGTEITLNATGLASGKVFVWEITDDSDNDVTDDVLSGNVLTVPDYDIFIGGQVAELYVKYTGALTEGDYIVYYSGKAMKNTISSDRFGYTTVTSVNDRIAISDASAIKWHIAPSGNYWTIYNADVSKYAASTGAAGKAQLLTDGSDDKSLWTASGTSTYDFVNKQNTANGVNAYLRNNGTYGFSCYAAGTGGALTLYRKAVSSTMAVASPANGTITATPSGGSAVAEGGSESVISGTIVSLSATGDVGYVLDAWDVYKTGDASTKVTVTSNQFTMPEYGVTVSASFRAPTTFTVEYSINGVVDDGLTESGVDEGDAVTLPTSGDVTPPSGYAFVGWSESETSGTLIGTATYTPTDDVTLYLVFIKSGESVGYNKVTSLGDITPGRYIIVNDNYCLPSSTTTSSPVKSNDYKVTNASSTSNYATIPANTEWIFTGNNAAMTIKNSGGSYLYSISSGTGIRVSTTSDTWAFETNSTGFAMKEANNSRYCATYGSGSDWRSYTTKDHDNYGDGGILYLYRKAQVYTRVYNATTTTMADIPATSIVTVPNGVTLTLTGTNNGYANNLIVNEGGQLVNTNAVAGTVKQAMPAFSGTWGTSASNGWKFISSPCSDVTVASFVSGAGSDGYDLYKWDGSESSPWVNKKAHEGTFEKTFATKTGYLAAYESATNFDFAGTINANADVSYTGIDYSGGGGLANIYLLGNPLAHDMAWSSFTKTNVNTYRAVVNSDGSFTYTNSGSVPVGEGFMVQTTAASPELTYSYGSKAAEESQSEEIRVSVSGDSGTDNAVVVLKATENDRFIRLGNINEAAPAVYTRADGTPYAVYGYTNEVQSVPLCFKAAVEGTYTINVETERHGVVLKDMKTGVTTSIGGSASYTFDAVPNDAETRFKLVLSVTGIDERGDVFAYMSGSNMIINETGLVHVVDMLGRVLVSRKVEGSATISFGNLNTGAYMVRLSNDSVVRTQKVIVK